MQMLQFAPGHGAPLRGFFAPWRALPSTSLRFQMLRAISASGGLWLLLFLGIWASLASLGLDREPIPMVQHPCPPTVTLPFNYEPKDMHPHGGPAAPTTEKSGTFHPVPTPDITLPIGLPDPGQVVTIDEPGAGPAASGDPIDFEHAPEVLPEFGAFVPHDVEPEDLVVIKPEYPELAKQAGVDGTVLVALLVGTDGRVKDARVTRSASPLLDRAALEALRRWVFRPALASGHPVAVWVSETVRFTLHDVE